MFADDRVATPSNSTILVLRLKALEVRYNPIQQWHLKISA